MNKLKMLFTQTLTISTGILFAIGIEGIISRLMGEDITFEWYYPISIILTGFVCALATLVCLSEEVTVIKQFMTRLVLHFTILFGVVSFAGYTFNWYSDLKHYIFLIIEYVIVYVFVWIATLWIAKSDEKKINQALKEIQDQE